MYANTRSISSFLMVLDVDFTWKTMCMSIFTSAVAIFLRPYGALLFFPHCLQGINSLSVIQCPYGTYPNMSIILSNAAKNTSTSSLVL